MMLSRGTALCLATLATFLCAYVAACPLPTSSQRVSLERPLYRAPHGWTRVERVSRHHPIHLQLFVKQQNIELLNTILLAVSDPTSNSYGKHLSLAQVNSLISPSSETRGAVMRWLESHGIRADQISATDAFDIVTVIAEAHVVEALLDAEYYHFNHTASNTCVIRTLAYSVPSEVAEHLDFVGPSVRFPRIHQRHARPVTETRPNDDDVTPDFIRSLYSVGDYRSTNANNTVATANFLTDNFGQQSDLNQFFSMFAPNSSGQLPTIIGPNNSSAPGVGAMLGIEWVMAIAADAHAQFWYINGSDPDNPGNEPFLYFLQNVSSVAEAPLVFSLAYDGDEESTVNQDYANRVNVEFQKAGVRGISIIVPSGEFGVSVDRSDRCTALAPVFPATSPYVTAVGAVTGDSLPEFACDFSGGGFSNYFARPSWQDDSVQNYLNNSHYLPCSDFWNRNGRAFPDLSAQAISYNLILYGLNQILQGTYCATAPVAGIFALLNDIRLNMGKSPLGFLNPLIYQNPQAFNDVTIGNNPGCNTEGFFASTGWDPVTGMGSPNFASLANIVKNLP